MTASVPGSGSSNFIDTDPCRTVRARFRAGHNFLVDVVGLRSARLIEHDGQAVHGEVQAGEHRFWFPPHSRPTHHPRDGGRAEQAASCSTSGRRRAAPRAPRPPEPPSFLSQPTETTRPPSEYQLREPSQASAGSVATHIASPAS